jgi:hypothetical protein
MTVTACQEVGAQLVVIKSDEEQVCLVGSSPPLEHAFDHWPTNWGGDDWSDMVFWVRGSLLYLESENTQVLNVNKYFGKYLKCK